MKIYSLIENRNQLEKAEVEIEFIPGIPQIHFLGLPDRLIKESFYRIKAAMKASGFKFPLTSQIIVNIKPNHLRKSSRGVELAVVMGILMKTEQIDSKYYSPESVFYGELGLDGFVFEPSDLASNFHRLRSCQIVTGRSTQENKLGGVSRINSLSENIPTYQTETLRFSRPTEGLKRFFTEREAELLFLAAVSKLHVLLAGDSGAGKSTLAKSLISFLDEPSVNENVRFQNEWRPFLMPHQSISPAAFIGGGSSLFEGEIERVQGGLLLLDEFLEFDPGVIELLRGPMTGEVMRIARSSSHREVQSNFQVAATTNLCPCGKWSPIKKQVSCRFSRTKCTRYLEKFSGPMLDRFGLLYYSETAQRRSINGAEVLLRIQKINDFLKIYNKISFQISEIGFDQFHHISARRKNYLEIVSQIFAIEDFIARSDLELKSFEKSLSNSVVDVQLDHVNRASKWVIHPFEQLERGMG